MNSSDYANLPAGKPPPGVMSNFDHPQSRAIVEYLGIGICLGITLVFVLLRVYVKLTVTRAWGWDDGACILGFGIIIAFAGVSLSMAAGKSVGNHVWDMRVTKYTKGYVQCLIAVFDLYSAAAFFVKLSLFLLYLRLFKPDKVTRWLIYGGILVNGLFYFATIVIYTAVVPPSPGQSDTDRSWILHATKREPLLKIFTVINGVFGIFSDIYLLVIPIRSIFQLHLSIQRKFGVSSIFLIGILAISCSVAGLFYRVKLLHEQDIAWFIVLVWTLCTAEICAGIICSCMPILKVLFRGHGSHKSLFAPLSAFFSRFSLRSFRQAYMSQQSHSFDRLNPDPVNDHLKGKFDDRIKLSSGIGFKKSKEAV